MKKFIAVFVLFSILIAPIRIPKAEAIAPTPTPNWNVTGNYVISFELGGSFYSHNLSLTQGAGGTLNGNGGYPSGGVHSYSWVLNSGSVNNDNITLSANYTASADAVVPQTVMLMSGTVAPNGSMSGIWSDNYQGGSRSGTWSTTEGAATQIMSNTVLVTGNTSIGENQPGWLFNRDTSTTTPFTFNNAQSSIGTGSLYVLPITNTLGTPGTKDKFIAENFINTPIANLNNISYDFKIGSGGVNTQEEQFYMNVYANFGVSNDLKYYDCRYDVVPTVGSTGSFTTVTFDPNMSYPVTTRTGGSASPFACPAIPADMDDLSAGSNIRAFAISLGDTSASDQGLDGYFDKVVVATNNFITTYNFDPIGTAKVTIVKYINGVAATTGNTNSTSFPMTATWNATNIGSGTGNYTLNQNGFYNPNPYQATTSDMTKGASYSTYENTGTSCISPMMYALVGYTTGETLEEAALGVPSLTTPSFTNLQTDKFVIVWNKTCVDLPTHLTPADNSVRTTAEQTLIDWSDVTNWANPITYMYQSALSMATNMDGSFTSPAYTSGVLTSSEIPTPGTPEGVYYWHVKATDSANNTSGWTIPWKITINNTGTLTVNKNVLKPDGMTEVSDNQSFSVMLNGSNTQNVSENSSYTYMNLTPGVYTVTEGVNGNYEFVSFSADEEGMTDGAQVTVVANQNTVVTITNKQKPATLTINKIVTNPNGGTAIATNFSFQVNGGTTTAFLQNGANILMGQNVLSVDPGTYTITEVLPTGAYAISYSEACTSAVLGSNGSATCTITNSDIPEGKGAITVRKVVSNMYGGTLVVSNFNLFTNNGGGNVGVTSGQSNFLDPGTYTISEATLPSGYMQASLVCSSNGDEPTSGTVVLTAQDSWVCTITNNDKPAKLTIIKKVVNEAWMPTLEETFNFNLTGEDTEEEIAITTEESEMMEEESRTYEQDYQAMGESEVLTLNAGEYTLTEDLLPEWNLTDVYCSSEEGMETENGVSLSLSNGEEVTCTFTNTRKTGTLIIEKIVSNNDGKTLTVSDFPGFTINGSEPIPFETEEENDMTGGETLIMQRGTYSISEPVTEGYFKIPENCDVVNIGEDETKTCKFTNEDVGFFVHSGGSGSRGGSVAGASIEVVEPVVETPAEAPKGEVLGATTCSAIYLNDFLYFGKKNNPEQVKLLQTFLNEELGLKLVVDGKYGRTTRNAVITFQEKYGTDILTPWAPFGLKSGKGTGNVYKTTKWKINMIKCADLKLEVPQLP